MRRRLSSFTKITFESLERLAKLDSLNLPNDTDGDKVLKAYETFLSTQSQSRFIPKCLYSDYIMSTGSFPFKSVDFADLKSKLKKSRLKSPSDELNTFLSSESFSIKDIKSVFLNKVYSKNYYPLEFRSTNFVYSHRRIELLVDVVCKNFCTLGVSDWNKIIENIIFLFNFSRPIGITTFDQSVLQLNESQMVEIVKKSNLLETSKFINYISFLYPKYQLPSEISEHLVESCTGLHNLEDSELLQVLIALPDKVKNDEVLQHYNKLVLKYEWIPVFDLMNLVVKMAKLKINIPIEALNKTEKSFEFILEKNNFERNLEYLRPLLELNLITNTFLNTICEQ